MVASFDQPFSTMQHRLDLFILGNGLTCNGGSIKFTNLKTFVYVRYIIKAQIKFDTQQ
jgi:hypothetical protein